jgi:hypothetical protein
VPPGGLGPRLLNAGLTPAGLPFFTITGAAGANFVIERNTNLTTLQWTTMSNVNSFSGSLNYTSPPPQLPQQYFRARVP